MKHFSYFFLFLWLTAVAVIIGCSSTDETAGERETKPVAQENKTPEQTTIIKNDTLNIDVENTRKPDYEPKTLLSSAEPTGRYSVQIGAYTQSANAGRIAALVKERFTQNVYMTLDQKDGLYKVMIGDFNSKDEARSFRDEMARQFPSDYKDAWVSENPQK